MHIHAAQGRTACIDGEKTRHDRSWQPNPQLGSSTSPFALEVDCCHVVATADCTKLAMLRHRFTTYVSNALQKSGGRRKRKPDFQYLGKEVNHSSASGM